MHIPFMIRYFTKHFQSADALLDLIIMHRENLHYLSPYFHIFIKKNAHKQKKANWLLPSLFWTETVITGSAYLDIVTKACIHFTISADLKHIFNGNSGDKLFCHLKMEN